MSEQVAVINEATCIGCTKCIQVCPTDAILGASKQMHTVLTDSCTGCGWCLPPCPVNCITLVPAQIPATPEARHTRAAIIKRRVQIRRARFARLDEQKKQADLQATTIDMKAAIAASIARSKKSWGPHE